MRRLAFLAAALWASVPGAGAPRLEVIAEGPGAGRHLAFAGRPVLLVGDSLTQGWVESGEDFDQKAYVRELARRGIRALLVWTFIAPQTGDDERIGYDAPDLLPWVKTGPMRWDVGKFEDAYFSRLRTLCELARKARIFVVLQVFDGWTKTRFDTHPFNARNGGPLEKRSQFVELADFEREIGKATGGRRERNQYLQERYAARLIAETSGFDNVLYELFNEGEWYSSEARRLHEAHFLAFFRARCRNVLISNADHIAGAAELDCDVVSHHRPNWSCDTSAAASFKHYRAGFAAKPLFFSEPVPEFGAEDPCEVEALTRLMWGTVLGGAGFVVQNDASFGFNPRARIAARSALRDVMLDREGACARFFSDLPVKWVAMEPVAGPAPVLARPGVEYAVYSEKGSPLTIDLSVSRGAVFERRFYDPRTGELGPPARVEGGRAGTAIETPDGRDWVLWMKKAP